MNQIPAADRPDDYNALEALKIVAAANNGTADAYVGNYHLDAGTPVPSGDEFVHRNSIIHTYDTSTFATFPGLEAGSSQHVSRFNYGITSASQYQYYSTGPPSIPDTHATGYPAQLDHPALPGGVTQQAAIANKGYGADLMETVPRGTNEATITTWDGILEQGVQLIGTWSSDAHRTETFGDSTAIWAPSLTFDPLIRSLYEGRLYMAQNSFTGRLLFGPDSAPQEPYPARYPIFVSPSASTANLTLDISGGLSGGTVEWVQEGTKVATDPVAGSTYHATKSISLATLPTYVRTQARTSSTKAIVTMSEPIFFEGVTGLPKDMTFHVAGVTTTDGEHYENVDLKGITAEQWSANALDLTLVNPAGSLVETVASTGGFTPSAVTVDGHAVSAASSLSAYNGATSSSWFFDSATRTLHVKATQGAATGTDLRVSFTGSTDTQPPSTPGNLQQTGATTTSISLGWNASNDNVGVSHYDVKLDGQLAASPTGTSITITGLDVLDVSLHHRRRGGRGGEHVVTSEADRGNCAMPADDDAHACRRRVRRCELGEHELRLVDEAAGRFIAGRAELSAVRPHGHQRSHERHAARLCNVRSHCGLRRPRRLRHELGRIDAELRKCPCLRRRCWPVLPARWWLRLTRASTLPPPFTAAG